VRGGAYSNQVEQDAEPQSAYWFAENLNNNAEASQFQNSAKTLKIKEN
jgi:hypothetical protein